MSSYQENTESLLGFRSRGHQIGSASPSKLKFKRPPKKLSFKAKKKQEEEDDEPSIDPSIESEEPEEELPPVKLKKPLKFKNKGPIQFGPDGLPIASHDNLDRMTEDEVSKFCSVWTVEKHLNPLMVQMADYISVAMSAPKSEKCAALVKYKQDFPSGARKQKQISYENAYESFNWRKETAVSFRGKSWVLPHSTDFKSEIMSRYSEYQLSDKDIQLNRVDPNDPNGVMKYQEIVGQLVDPRTPYRGQLVFHGLGSGKTRTAIEAANRFIRDNKKILVLLPGSLRSNFIVELFNYGSVEHGIGIENYKTLKDSDRQQKEKAASSVIKHYFDILTYNERGVYDKLKALTNPETGNLENRLIIVDEIHNLVSRMSKATNLSRQVYHFLMDRTYNCKMLLLSGTPLLNDAYELGVLFNILRGKFRTPQGNYTLFPENEEDFNDKFVNIYDKSVVNQQLFKRRVSGLISYYAGTTDKKGMPEEIEHPVEKLPMSDHQFQLYIVERMNESKKESKKSKRRNTGEATGSAFRTYSRMVCNFSFPKGIVRPKPISARDIKTYQKYANQRIDTSKLDLDDVQDEIDPSKLEGFKSPRAIRDEEEEDVFSGKERVLTKKQREETYALLLAEALIELENMADSVFAKERLPEYSPKMFKIYDNMENAPGNEGLIYIYTEFRILEGVRIMGSVLKYNGYEKTDYTGINTFDDFKKKYKAGQKRYGIISSDEDSKQRKILLEVFNHPENAHGEYIKCIMGTSASSEGINLKRVRQIHIMEPYWNMVRNNQVKGRGVRFGSHLDLPADEQNVHVYSYQITLTGSQQREIIDLLDNPKEANSTDEHIHRLALSKDVINSQFLKMIKEAAVDCGLNFLMNIKRDPDLQCLDIPKEVGTYMYLPDINDDPEDQEFMKSIKYEEYIVGKLQMGETVFGYKAHPTGRPILDPPSIVHNNKTYHQVLTLYDFDLLNSGIEVKKRYYVVGTDIVINL